MRRVWASVSATFLLFLIAVGFAAADIGPRLQVQLMGEPRAAQAGQPYEGQIRIQSSIPGTVSNMTLSGAGWQVLELNVAAQIDLRADDSFSFDFRVLASDPTSRLSLSFDWNGRGIHRSFDLSSESIQQVAGVVSVEGSERTIRPSGLDDLVKPDPTTDDESIVPPSRERGRGRDIRVAGRFVYYRDDGFMIGADGMKVDVYDDDPGADDHCATFVTDAYGYFDETFWFDDYWEEYPDIYFKFHSQNAECDVKHATWSYTYGWETSIHNDVTSFLDIGTIQSDDESLHGAVHVLTDIVRTWRWYNNLGYDCDETDVYWPDDVGDTYYTPHPYENIHIGEDRTWREDSHSHEYGHHFMDDFAELTSPDYCNDICDPNPPTDCGHCIWCRENHQDAWQEGVANYSAHRVPSSFLGSYGLAAQHIRDVDSLNTCGEDGLFHEPDITEGYPSAVLVDIDDADHDDHSHFPGYSDLLNMGPDEILECIDLTHPLNIHEFLASFESYIGAFFTEEYWETGMNCGFDVDDELPGTVQNLVSTTHSPGVPSADPTVAMIWNTADDDWSGIEGYSVSVTSGSPAMPNTSMEIGRMLGMITDPLSPGTYYFNIRALDRAGHWSNDYESWGPIVIREPEPCDLAFTQPTGWEYPFVPSARNDNTYGSCVVSDTLPGNGGTTYWNVAGRNVGESPTSEEVIGRTYVDDAEFYGDNFGIVNGGQQFYAINRSPLLIDGGRHVFHYKLDAWDDIAETLESNNTWGHQFVWSPIPLAPGVVRTESAPRHALLAWENVVDGSPLYWNCSGFRFENTAWWNVALVWPTDTEDNFDARLHLPSTGAENGFASPVATSTRGFGHLDGFVINSNETSQPDFDMGVVFYGVYYANPIKVVHLENHTILFDNPIVETFGFDNWFRLYEFYVPSNRVGWITARIESDPPTSAITLQWRNEFFIGGDLSTCTAQTTSGTDGTAYLQFNVGETGYNSLAIFRDPIDGDQGVEVTITLMSTPPDLRPLLAQGWHSPMVPRAADDGSYQQVLLPDSLIGDWNSTYYNLALKNDSPGDADSVDVTVWLDGKPSLNLHYGSFGGNLESRVNWHYPTAVRGGRHTLDLWIDPDEELAEIDEWNNTYAEQYCWSPISLTPGSVTDRPAAPDRIGGWEHVDSGEVLWYNADGIRMQGLTSYWAALAVMPAVGDNVDVRLHEVLVGSKEGFAQNLASSGWGVSSSDYVLVNFNETSRRDFDAGIVRVSGEYPYYAHCVEETYLGVGNGTYGPYSLPPWEIVHLYEMILYPGPYTIELETQSPDVDWGICLHPSDEAYLTKSMTVPDGGAWYAGEGEGETITVVIPSPANYYCLAVWKANSQSLFKDGSYRFIVTAGPASAEDEADRPKFTTLHRASPNPANAHARIDFDLAAPEQVTIAVFDATGGRVRTLLDRRVPVGRHTLTWDGKDMAGHPVASGVYWIRMMAGRIDETEKILMVR